MDEPQIELVSVPVSPEILELQEIAAERLAYELDALTPADRKMLFEIDAKWSAELEARFLFGRD